MTLVIMPVQLYIHTGTVVPDILSSLTPIIWPILGKIGVEIRPNRKFSYASLNRCIYSYDP